MARIIMADDDAIIGDIACNALIDAGHSAGLLSNGRDALRVIKTRRPDLVILDCNMPEMNGLMVLREIRKLPDLYDVPVLILSGRRGDNDVELAHFEGADEYMKKPFDADELVFRVGALLVRKKPAGYTVRPAARHGFGRAAAARTQPAR